LLVTVGSGKDSAFGEFQAGVARIKITPDRPMVLSGKHQRTRPAEATLHELWAKALVLQDADGRRVVLVALDLVGIDGALSGAIRDELRQRYGLERGQVALATSHTHNGPVVGGNLAGMFFLDAAQQALLDRYAVGLRTKVVAVVGEALGRLAPCRLSYGVGKADFAINRRNNPRSEIDARLARGDFRGPVDHDVPVLSVADRQGRLRAVVFGYACHPIWLRHFPVWSGDYPGVAQARIEQTNPGATALFLAGCGGDQNPVSRGGVLERAESQAALLDAGWRKAAAKEVEDLGRRLAAAVEAVLVGKPTSVDGTLAFAYREVDLPLAPAPGQEQLLRETASPDRFIARRARTLLREADAGGRPRASYPYPLQVWRLGERLVLVTLGGEAVVDYALRLKRELGADRTWVAAYCNDVMAYVPSRRVLLEGGYEGGDSMVYYGLPAPWAPEVEDLIVRTTVEQVTALRKTPSKGCTPFNP
jgi:hypothetical protein